MFWKVPEVVYHFLVVLGWPGAYPVSWITFNLFGEVIPHSKQTGGKYVPLVSQLPILYLLGSSPGLLIWEHVGHWFKIEIFDINSDCQPPIVHTLDIPGKRLPWEQAFTWTLQTSRELALQWLGQPGITWTHLMKVVFPCRCMMFLAEWMQLFGAGIMCVRILILSQGELSGVPRADAFIWYYCICVNV